MFSLGAPAKLAPAAWVIYYVLLVGAAAVAVHVMAVVWKLSSYLESSVSQCFLGFFYH